jgi:hypothetical protein
MVMIPLIKPSGVKVYVNSESLEYALSLGWKPEVTEQVTEQAPAPIKQEVKRGRPFKSA